MADSGFYYLEPNQKALIFHVWELNLFVSLGQSNGFGKLYQDVIFPICEEIIPVHEKGWKETGKNQVRSGSISKVACFF